MEKSEKIELESKKARIGKGIAGTALSLIMFGGLGVILIIVGIILSLTIIGAIIGIPMILFGLMSIILSPFGGLGAAFNGKRIGFAPKGVKRMPCPYCKNEVAFIKEKALDCPVCKKRLLVKDGSLFLVE